MSTQISEPIFKRDSSGGVRIWYAEANGDKWRTVHGVQFGTMVTSEWTVCTPKSQPTAEEQALFEADAERDKKLARDYRVSVMEVDVPRDSGVKPMLAHKYEGKTVFPVYSQPKLDGVRCTANRFGLWSREGKPITACPHIRDALAHVFSAFPDAVLDGELYNHALKDDFNEIVSIVKRKTVSAADLKKAELMIQYHIYDVASLPDNFGDRSSWLEANVDDDSLNPLHLVETTLVTNQAGLDTAYDAYLADGYEGQMVRLDKGYDQKRSKSLLKRKEFQDAEFKVIKLEEGLGNWAGYAKKATLELADGRTFGAGIKGTQAQCKALLGTNPTSATIRYFALTPDGVPRFPIAVQFYDGARL